MHAGAMATNLDLLILWWRPLPKLAKPHVQHMAKLHKNMSGFVPLGARQEDEEAQEAQPPRNKVGLVQ